MDRRESEEYLECINTRDNFLNTAQIVQGLRLTINGALYGWLAQLVVNNKQDLVNLKSFSKAKDTINGKKWQPTDWEKIFTKPTFDIGLPSKIYKELKTLDTNKPNNPIQ